MNKINLYTEKTLSPDNKQFLTKLRQYGWDARYTHNDTGVSDGSLDPDELRLSLVAPRSDGFHRTLTNNENPLTAVTELEGTPSMTVQTLLTNLRKTLKSGSVSDGKTKIPVEEFGPELGQRP